MNHRLFIIRLLGLLKRCREKICIGVTHEFPDGKYELRPVGPIEDAYEYWDASEHYRVVSFNKSVEIVLRDAGKEDVFLLESVTACGASVYLKPQGRGLITIESPVLDYDESMGFTERRPYELSMRLPIRAQSVSRTGESPAPEGLSRGRVWPPDSGSAP